MANKARVGSIRTNLVIPVQWWRTLQEEARTRQPRLKGAGPVVREAVWEWAEKRNISLE